MPWALAQGEISLGMNSTVLLACQNYLHYPADIDLNLKDNTAKAVKFIKLASTFFALRNKYDIYHFNFGSSLIHFPSYNLNLLDLPFYPDRAKLFVTYNGCDARQKYPAMQRASIAPCHDPGCCGSQCTSGKMDEYRRKSIQKMSRYVRHIWAVNPDLLYFLPVGKASFLPYAVLSAGAAAVPLPDFSKKKLKIVHAPTNRIAKGTDHILSVISKIQQTHADYIEFRLIENLAHQEALKIYQEADLVIDQILIGWYGAFAVETMMMGKPVIARIAREDLHFIPEQMAKDVLASVINADPSTLYGVLLRCLEDRAMLRQYAQAALDYANHWHNPAFVAGITKAEYEKD
ncbi:MAG: hypothetical protein PHD29_06565 [bacterium]|nr:hypothetical protein [bacterium]MDD5353798.1 hypothetical protein [bacterium]MDD5756170.1 hypothetical protein [bacterium]